MPKKRLFVIANPSAGTGDDAKATSDLKSQLDQRPFTYDMKIVATPDEAATAAERANSGNYDAIVVYGGDGTAVTVFKAVRAHSLPILILPGGSANILAKALRMPADIGQCLDLFATDLYVLRYFGIATANDQPLVLDLHFGVWADTIRSANESNKRLLGKFAYALSAAKQFNQAKKFDYRLTIDDQEVALPAYACMIANDGAHSALGVPLFPYPHVRGLLQIALVKRVSTLALIRWYCLRRLGLGDQSVITTYRAKKVEVLQAPPEMLFDDLAKKPILPLQISTTSHTVTAIAPAAKTGNWLRRGLLRFQTMPMRQYDHIRRRFSGGPNLRTSQILPNLYVGGRYRPGAARLLKSWGVTGVVNLRQLRHPTVTPGLEVLNLPTPDHQPPTIEALQKGVQFIDRHLKAGGGAYVHCRLGEGRGPTMAAAYLISQGMRAKDAVSHIERYRPLSRPNPRQLRQLAQFESLLAQQKH